MNKYISILVWCILFFSFNSIHAQMTNDTLTVEAACGQCQFNMTDKKGCDLAVRINGKNSYFVEGSDIDAHGDAHAHDGFCNAIRKAHIVGKIENKKFVLKYFRLLPNKK